MNSADFIRTAFDAYSRGDRAAILDAIDPDVEWTYLDPSIEDPEPQVCHGRHEFETALERQAQLGLRSELEEVVGNGERVVVISHTPGLDAFRARQNDDRNFDVLTVRAGRVVAIRACRDRSEAFQAAGLT